MGNPSLPVILRVLTFIISFGLCIFSILGFRHIAKTRPSSPTAQEMANLSNLGCLCFLGLCFGIILSISETKMELFFFYFGFLRYRIGKAILHGVAGIMLLLIGSTWNKQCNCADYTLVLIQGVACLVIFILQILCIFLLGNTDAPQPNSLNNTMTTKASTTTGARFLAANEIKSNEKPIPQNSRKIEEKEVGSPDPNAPSWMKV